MNKNIRRLKVTRSMALEFSKDPSTQVAASIWRKDGSISSFGYNGFCSGIEDTDERLNDPEFKRLVTIHAEENALLKAYEDVSGFSLYVYPLIPCPHCASLIINSGISRVVAPNKTKTNGGSDLSLTIELFEEAGVSLQYLEID